MEQSAVDFLKEKLEDGHLDISDRYWNELLTEARKIEKNSKKNQNKMDITKNVFRTLETNKVLLKVRKGKFDKLRKTNKCTYQGQHITIEQFDCVSIGLGLFSKYEVLLTLQGYELTEVQKAAISLL